MVPAPMYMSALQSNRLMPQLRGKRRVRDFQRFHRGEKRRGEAAAVAAVGGLSGEPRMILPGQPLAPASTACDEARRVQLVVADDGRAHAAAFVSTRVGSPVVRKITSPPSKPKYSRFCVGESW